MQAFHLLVLVFTLIATLASAADTEVLVRSGTRATDGLALDAVAEPAARRDGVVFRGSTSAVFAGGPDGLGVLARTGDPLPAPVRGTWSGFTRVIAAPGGRAAVLAALDSPDADTGLFLFDGGITTALALGAVSVPGVNAAGQLAYVTDARIVSLWDPQHGATVVAATGDPAPAGGTFTSFPDGALVNGAGVVAAFAIAGPRQEIVVGAPGGPLREVPVSRPPRSIALNERGDVAFIVGSTSNFDVFVSSVDGALVTRVAGSNDLVDGLAVRRLASSRLVLDESGGVVFRARLERGTVWVRASAGTLVAVPAPSSPTNFASLSETDDTPLGSGFTSVDGMESAGTRVIAASRPGLYTVGEGPPTVLVTAAEPILQPNALTGPFAVVGPDVVVRTFEGRIPGFVALREERAPRPIVPQPGAGLTLDFSSPVLVTTANAIIVPGTLEDSRTLPGIFSIDASSGRVTPVVVADLDLGGRHRLVDLGTFAVGARRLVFRGLREDGVSGLFAATRRRPRAIVTTGLEGPRPPAVSGFGTLAASRRRLYFAATAPDGRDGIFRTGRRGVQTVTSSSTPAPGGGVFAPLQTDGDGRPALPLVVSGGRAAFVASIDLSPDEQRAALFVARAQDVTRVLGEGDTVPSVGTIATLGQIALAGRTVLVDVRLAGAGARSALLRITP